MKRFFYDEWTKKRIDKIKNLFGENWFAGKNILELGCAHGDIGKEFLKLGAFVSFSDYNESYLKRLAEELEELNVHTNLGVINQNEDYYLNNQYDLILHMSILYHIENWKRDLEISLKHTNKMILETSVLPESHPPLNVIKDDGDMEYSSGGKNIIFVTEREIENHLDSLGCKYLKIEDSKLNTNFSTQCAIESKTDAIRHVYDWNENNWQYYYTDSFDRCNIHFRRMWLIIK